MRCCGLTEDDERCPNTALKGFSVCPAHAQNKPPPSAQPKKPPRRKRSTKLKAKVRKLRRDVGEMLGGDKNYDTLLSGMVIVGATRFGTMDPDKLARYFGVQFYRVQAVVKRLRECRIWEGDLMDIGMWMDDEIDLSPEIRLVSFTLQALAGAGLVVPEKKGELFTEETKWRVV